MFLLDNAFFFKSYLHKILTIKSYNIILDRNKESRLLNKMITLLFWLQQLVVQIQAVVRLFWEHQDLKLYSL